MQESTAEQKRLIQADTHEYDWKLWGPYLAERQWATVREDYSGDGNCWAYFPYEMATRRAYRWGEDGLFGFSDRKSRICFGLALWNGHDALLKERLFGLTGPEGNHGEDVKEEYFYLDATPTHSYMKALYKYPQKEFPYADLRAENARRQIEDPEYELLDTGVFADGRYFDVETEYIKAAYNDILIRVTIHNRGPETADLTVLPQLWARNTWSWGANHEGDDQCTTFSASGKHAITTEHQSLGTYTLYAEAVDKSFNGMLFTENETRYEDESGKASVKARYFKDAFHRYVINGEQGVVNPRKTGSKSAYHYQMRIKPGASKVLRLRLSGGKPKTDPFADFERLRERRKREADCFYQGIIEAAHTAEEQTIMRQAYAGLLWSKQFYYYVVKDWLRGDALQPAPPSGRAKGRNHEWKHLYNRDVISMPDKWEYPWYAAWDLAFHMIPFAKLDQRFAQSQLILLLREWYMHPNGQIPAYEFQFSAVNPPVHAWATLKVYLTSGKVGWRDREFLTRVFHKLLLNFTWWVNRTDIEGRNLFSGGFLGLDNIGIFDRGATLPTGGILEQADATAWMGFNCACLLEMSLELAHGDSSFSDIATKFFEHFMGINEAINGADGLWDEEDSFYYDTVRMDGSKVPLKVRSMVGLIPLFAVSEINEHTLTALSGFRKRLDWAMENRPEIAMHLIYSHENKQRILLSLVNKFNLRRMLKYVFDEAEFLSPFGIRSLSKYHKEHPLIFEAGGTQYRVDYAPGNSQTTMFGGNSNWRGPIWFPLNYLLVESLLRYYEFYGDSFTIEYPTGSGNVHKLDEIAADICSRLSKLFLRDPQTGRRPFWGAQDMRGHAHWDQHMLFHEYFHADTGEGLGASHQTGWTALVTWCLDRAKPLPSPSATEAEPEAEPEQAPESTAASDRAGESAASTDARL